ncbi:MAG: hypothetical protein A2020_14025 [Lentisphaerae bacterium GWF2_45_14]|nr:MAG: hypothetical protein A2020_14025 [Lentisphaerae bacterium GWF2_45_14]
MMKLPNVWREPFSDYISSSLKNEAAKAFRVHQLPEKIGDWKKAREKLRKRLWDSLGVTVDHGLELDYHETGEVKMDGYTVKKVYYQSRKDFYVTGNLYIPDGKGPFPGVICMHGHWAQGRLAERVQGRGHSLAQNAYVCLTVDAFGSGERSTEHGVFEYHGGTLGASLMNIGETLMGSQIVDNMRGVDLLCSLGYVDSSKIGATGASGGGNQTMWLAAMDERVKASVPVVSVGSFQSYVMASNCICELLPDGLTYTEESGVLALAAPNAMKICNCLGDSNPTFYPAEMLRTYAEARKIFQLYGTDEKFTYQVFNMPHGYWPEIREAMLGFFDLHLKGIGHGAPKTEKDFETLAEEKLMVFKKGKRSDKVVSIAEHCHKQGMALRKGFLGKKRMDAETARKDLLKILRINKNLALKQLHVYSTAGEWERFALETECGRMIPVLLRKPVGKKSEYMALASPCGKGELAENEIMKKALASGKGVLLFDLWASGETDTTTDPQSLPHYHAISRSALWLGYSIMGEWVKDYLLLSSFLKDFQEASEITLYGIGDAGLAALFAAALTSGKSNLILEKIPLSFAFDKGTQPTFFTMASYLPGILRWGDVSLAAALVNGQLRFINPAMSDGKALATKNLNAFEKEFKDIAGKCGGLSKSIFER